MPDVTINVENTVIELTDDRPIIEVSPYGPQGPPGVDNVVVSATQPTNTFEGLIWVQPL